MPNTIKMTPAQILTAGLDPEAGEAVYLVDGACEEKAAQRVAHRCEASRRPFGSMFDLRVTYVMPGQGRTFIFAAVTECGYSAS